MDPETSAHVSARTSLATASYLNFLERFAPGGFRRLRSWWNLRNKNGAMGRWRAGEGGAGRSVLASSDLRNDMIRRRCILFGPFKSVRSSVTGRLARGPRLEDLKECALASAPETVCTAYTDASGAAGRGAFWGDSFPQGKWPSMANEEGVNWEVPWALGEALYQWIGRFLGEWVLARTENAAAVAYASSGGLWRRSGAVGTRDQGVRTSFWVGGGRFTYPWPGQPASGRIVPLRGQGEQRGSVSGQRVAGLFPRPSGGRMWRPTMGRMRGPAYRCPANLAFKGPLPDGRMRLFLRADTVELV